MNIEQYIWGEARKGRSYEYFLPASINESWLWEDSDINTLLEEASIKLGELNAFARLVPTIDLFILLHVTTEAVVSSRIEGTQTNIDEALLDEKDVSLERRDDWNEVKNYINALNTAIDQLKELPISTRLICNTHELLMQGVRGERKQPGEFRNSQNWIGGASINDAIFIPPDHPHVDVLMSDLEEFVHNEQIKVPDLIRIGMIHYQFETIHPFLDGNGRIGRLLITLYLVSKGILDKPLLYLSKFFEKNKGNYYDNLMRVRDKNDMIHWLKFFLVGIRDTAIEASDTLSSILLLKNRLDQQIRNDWGRRVDSASKLLDYLFKQPIVDISKVQEVCDLSPKAAGDLVRSFEEAGILKEWTGQSRNRSFEFTEYLEKFRA
tara:strand:+ start:758 stop:1894 length:1137 start_codon:yes stop_codon:yes gene_type:complete